MAAAASSVTWVDVERALRDQLWTSMHPSKAMPAGWLPMAQGAIILMCDAFVEERFPKYASRKPGSTYLLWRNLVQARGGSLLYLSVAQSMLLDSMDNKNAWKFYLSRTSPEELREVLAVKDGRAINGDSIRNPTAEERADVRARLEYLARPRPAAAAASNSSIVSQGALMHTDRLRLVAATLTTEGTAEELAARIRRAKRSLDELLKSLERSNKQKTV